MRRLDVLAFVAGILMTALALGCLWFLTTGTVSWPVLRVGAPAFLVAVGLLGLALSRVRR